MRRDRNGRGAVLDWGWLGFGSDALGMMSYDGESGEGEAASRVYEYE